MAKKIATALQFAAAFLVALSLGTSTGRAQTAQNPVPPIPAPAHPPAHKQLPVQPEAGRIQSPFDRVIAPSIARMLKGKRAVAPVAAKPKANAATATTVGLNGGRKPPTFASTPYRTLNDGSGAYVANTVTGDFNADGKPDVAMVKEDGTIDVILSPGPNIASQTPIVSNATGNPLGLQIVYAIAADMNGDGKIDLVGQDYANAQTVVWISNGDGTFSAPHGYPSKFSIPTAPPGDQAVFSTYSTMVGDFNHDGTMDVVTLSIWNDLTINTSTIIVQTLLNNGTGILDPLPQQNTLFNDFYYEYIGNAAVTTDGTNPTGIVFLLGDEGANNGYVSGNEIIAMTSNGDGTFQPPIEPTAIPYIPDYNIETYGSVVATNLTAKGPGQPTTDIVFLTGDGAVWDAPFTSGNPAGAHILTGANFWINIFNPTYAALPPTSFNNTVIFGETALNVADMNGDGLEDLVVYTNNGIQVFPNAGSGVFSSPPSQLNSDQGLVLQPQPANYDGSGYNSLIDVDYYFGQVGYIQNLGAAASPQTGQFIGTIVPTGTNTTENAEFLGSNFQIYATADINGDGILDVIGLDIANSDSNIANVVVGLSNGSAPGNQINNYTFTTVTDGNSTFNTPYQYSYIEPVTISNAAGTSILFLNSGYGVNSGGPPLFYMTAGKDGVFGPAHGLDFGAAIAEACTLELTDVGDVNGDGVPDIVAACGSGPYDTASGFFTFLGNPDGTFQTATFTPLGKALYRVRLINFSGAPGNMDLAAFDYSLADPINPALSVYVVPNKGDGSGTFDLTRLTRPVTNFLVTDIVPGDFNADGKQDLTLLTLGEYDPLPQAADPYTSGVLLLPGNGDYTFGQSTLANAGNAAVTGAYADFTGDGFPDLAMNVLFANIQQYSYTAAPMAQVLPNLGNGTFGAPIVEFHSYTPLGEAQDQTTFVGPFTRSGGPDMLIGSVFGAALYVNSGVTTLNLTASSITPGQGAPVTLTATISQTQGAGVAPTGVVLFTSAGTTIGSAVPVNGVATFTTTQLPVGADAITATFVGDAAHNQSSASITVTVAAVSPSFTLSAPTPTLSLTQGGNGSLVVTLTGNSTFNGVVQLTCSGAPAEVSCTASPASVTLGPGQSSNASVLIVTTPPNNTEQANAASTKGAGKRTLVGISLAGLLLLLWPRRRRLPKLLSMLVIAALALTSLGALSGCGGSGNKYPGTVAGSYTLTVTAVSGAITQTQSIALTVTKP